MNPLIMLEKARLFLRSLFKASTKTVIQVSNNVVEGKDISMPYETKQEVAYFNRKNNLQKEFIYTPTPVYSSSLSDNTIIGYLDQNGNIIANPEYDPKAEKIERYRGYIIKYHDLEELEINRNRIDYRIHNSLSITNYLTEDEYDSLQLINKQGNQFVDDVDKLKSDPNYAKPDLTDTDTKSDKTYIIEADPFKVAELQEANKQAKEVEENHKKFLGVPIDSEIAGVVVNELEYKDFSNTNTRDSKITQIP